MPVLVAVRDLLFRSRIQEAAQRLGLDVRLLPRGTPLPDGTRAMGAGTVIADLQEPGALEAIRAAKATAGVRVIGFLGHLEADLARAAADAGADEVLSRGELSRRLDDVLRAASGAPAGAG
jgi:DNA-binding NarL/FixJ family response regulator